MYETGVLIAFICWVTSIVNTFIRLNSQLANNLQKVGLRLSVWHGGHFPVRYDEPPHRLKRFIQGAIAALIGLLFIGTSWFYVALFFAPMIYSWAKDRGAPAELRTIRWKLRNLPLTREQVIEAIASMPEPSSEARAGVINDLKERGFPV